MPRIEPLALPNPVSGVLSFDFDGTLHMPDDHDPINAEFFAEIQELRERGWIWGINTGRSLIQLLEGLVESKVPFLPDYIIAREREIYVPGNFGRWVPMGDWNERCEKDQQKLLKKAKKPLRRIRKFIEQETGAQWVEMPGDPAGIIAQSIEEMERIVEVVEQECAAMPLLGYLRNTIYMRFSHHDYHKGTGLRAVCESYGISSQCAFAIGDGHNDLGMLDAQYAWHIACPANADDEVRQHVEANGGYVASQSGSLGVIESLRNLLDRRIEGGETVRPINLK